MLKEDYKTVAETSKELGISRQYIGRMITHGMIRAVKFGNQFLLPTTSVEKERATRIKYHKEKLAELQ